MPHRSRWQIARTAAALVLLGGCAAGPPVRELPEARTAAAAYHGLLTLRGDLHLHSSTGSFDARSCRGECTVLDAHQQLRAARAAGLDFAALTEHDRDPNAPHLRLDAELWRELQGICQEHSDADFQVLCGYEWTHSQKSCASADRRGAPDWNHKIALLPPGAPEFCGVECETPDRLAEFLARAGGVGFTPHPWRFELIDPPAGFPSFVTRDYFLYDSSDDEEGHPFIGAEVGPDFLPLREEWAWPVVCEHPETAVRSRTVTLPEWSEALGAGKRLAALATSDRTFDFIDFRQRTTLVFATSRSPEAILEALRARRTMAAYLEPFALRFSIGGVPVGRTADAGPIRLDLEAEAGEVLEMKLRSPRGDLEVWRGDSGLGSREIAVPADDPGPFWIEVYGRETDPVVGTPRTTITSPIWLAAGR
ncbi:MAG: hypothetical protein AAF725_21035 [Acidobacteriota bacterium]